MAVTTVNVTGPVEAPDATGVDGATIRFTLNRVDVDTVDGVTIYPEAKAATLDSGGDFTQALWPNSRGQMGSKYSVVMYAGGAETPLGKISVPEDGAPHGLEDLLAAGEPAPGAVYMGLITQEQYDAAIAAADFGTLYLGSKASDPTEDNDGDPLVEGAMYFNSTSDKMRVYDGASWGDVTEGADGDVKGPASSTDDNFAAFDGVTGKTLKDSGKKASDFATAAQGAKADTATQPGDLATVATTGDYDDLTNKPTLGTAAANDTGDFATAAQGAKADSAQQPPSEGAFVDGDKTKLDGIETGATGDLSNEEVAIKYGNWVAQVSSGEKTAGTETQIRRFSPKDVADMAGTHGGGGGGGGDVSGPASSTDDHFASFDGATGKLLQDSGKGASDFATAAQGAKADTATQPGDLATVATTGAYSDLSGKPTLGTAAASDTGDFATAAQGTKADNALPKAGGTMTGELVLKETKETVYALSGTAIDPANGTIQTKTFSANTTFTESLQSGQSVTLHLADGDSYTITWPTITWVGGAAPTLTSDDVVVIWKVGSTLYGAYIGSVE